MSKRMLGQAVLAGLKNIRPALTLKGTCPSCKTAVVHKLFTTDQSAQITGYTPQSIHNWRDKGFLLSHKVSGRFLYEAWMLDDALDNLGYSLENEHTTIEER